MKSKFNISSPSKESLEKKNFFKIVCGASFTDLVAVENLAFLFTLANVDMIDLAPRADVIFAARKGVKKALNFDFDASSPEIMASIQLDEDPHFRKAEVDFNACDICGVCVKVCPTEAFSIKDPKSNFIYASERCFGCGICPDVCHVDALKMVQTTPSPKEALEEIIKLGVSSVEIHFGKGYKRLESIWDEIKHLVFALDCISFSIGSNLLTNEEILEAAQLCFRLAGEGIIIQCDGKPMSGGLKNGNNLDMDSIDVAKLVLAENMPVYLQISGGTDEGSYTKAKELNVPINGVAIGSYARKKLMPYISKKDLMEDKELLEKGLKIAKSLVGSVKLELHGEKLYSI